MWYLLQTLKHVETDTPVIYLGINCDKPVEKSVITRTSDGRIINGPIKAFVPYTDDKGQAIPGKYAINEFFGRVKRRLWKNYVPDLSITNKRLNIDPL